MVGNKVCGSGTYHFQLILRALRANSHRGLSHPNYPAFRATQRSLDSNHTALSTAFFFSLAQPNNLCLLHDLEVLGRVTVHLYHPPIRQESPCRPYALCSSVPKSPPVLAVLIAEWPCWGWTHSFPPPGLLLALMHCCGSGWMLILLWIPSLIFSTVVGSRHKHMFILKGLV